MNAVPTPLKTTPYIQKWFYGPPIIQGRLKIWTSDSHWFSLSLKPLEISLQKFQHSYNSWKSGFSQNLEDVAQKLSLPRPFDVLDVFGRKSKFWAPRTFIFYTQQVPIEFNNWWKFGVDISELFLNYTLQILRESTFL